MEAAQKKADAKSTFAECDYSNFYYGAGDDPLNLLKPYADWFRAARPNGYYLYQEALSSAPTTRVRVKNGQTGKTHDLLNLASYNYLGISYRPEVKRAAVEAVPNADFATSTSPDGKHRATVRIPARTYPVATLGAARALVRAFIEDNGLGGGNLPPTAGRVRSLNRPQVGA